jgi:NAD(P)-dependent dehydrogenase (short-subunit alcohol dehydrogenase family)
VIATSRSTPKPEDFPKSENLRLQQLDITDGAAVVKRKVDEAVAWFGRIDVLVNNAGVCKIAFLEEGG